MNLLFPPGFRGLNLYLDHNQISRIHNGAFLGLENVTMRLNLGHNRLSSISYEFTRLRGLQSLRIEKNPLTVAGIPDGVIRNMFYNDIYTIALSSYDLLKKVMKNGRNKIDHLHIYDINETRFDQELFVKEQHTALHTLTIENCAFSDFSEVLCNLDLILLSLNMCWNVNDTTLQGCPQNHTVSLKIQDCATTDALDPSAFYNAPVRDLVLTGNINLVPRSLFNHLPNLKTLHLKGHMQRIQKDDFEDLTELQFLEINSNNTITFVDNEAFKTNLKLNQLQLSYSSLNNLSPSIKNLTLLETLSLPDMTCSCATMGALKGGNYSSMYIYGDCKNIPGQSIKSYLNNDITACP